jgi:hypothetical protein
MPSKRSEFISSRPKPISLIEQRVKSILWYTVECYTLLQNDKPSYKKNVIKENTKYNFEDYLKMEFVDEYLIKNKYLLKNRTSDLEEINFAYEPVKRFKDLAGKERSDKIDVYINKLGLNKSLSIPDEHCYFVFECKRLEILSDTEKYIDDTQNFADRDYLQNRLPFEGQIAFIEHPKLSSDKVCTEINRRLDERKSEIVTIEFLTKTKFHKSFSSSYKSKHKKRFGKNQEFTIYHLMFDYSSLVVE